MASLIDIKGLIACGAAQVLGTGTAGCKAFFKRVVAVWLMPAGFVFDEAQDFDLTYIQLLQAQGNLIVLNGIQTFTDNTPDDVTEELEGGTKVYIRGALYEFAMQFINGLYFHSALHALSGYSDYDAILVDRDANILGTASASGALKGFTLGMLQASKLQFGDDTTQQREGIMAQLTNRRQLDRNYYFIDNANISPFDPTLVEGINQSQVSASPPSGAATTLVVKVTRKQDGAIITGLEFGDFLVQVNGTTNNPTSAPESPPGTYTLTGLSAVATNDKVTTQLYDNANNRNVINKTQVLYKSNIDEVTVT